VFARPESGEGPRDVDVALYDGLVGNGDRRTLDRLRQMPPAQLAETRVAFEDPRLEELVFRYRARLYPETLNDDERARWEAHRAARLHQGQGGALTLARFFDEVDRLGESAEDERSQALLGSLYDYAESIAPDPAAVEAG
jgi:exodeoxyribonuclease-1